MSGHVYRLSSSFELPLEDLREFLADPDLPPEVTSVEVTRRNNTLLVTSTAADDSLSKYTPTAQLKASVEEKRVYEEDPDDRQNQPWKPPQDQEEIESELVEFACFTGDREAVLQNTALQYPMFLVLREVALQAEEGRLSAITAVDDELQAHLIVDGTARDADVEVVEASQRDDGQTNSAGVNWGSQ